MDIQPKSEHRPLAIVGSHPKTRGLAPYDDLKFEIWLFNEAAQKPDIYKRWDALLQIHKPEVYTNPNNWIDKSHWAWLQQEHPGKRIYMYQADPRVPNSVSYPWEGVLSLIPYRYLRSSPAIALALAIYLGYPEIHLYGSELTSNTDYTYQAPNLAFWIGFAHGKGVNLQLNCWQDEFNQLIYGLEGELGLKQTVYQERFSMHERAWKTNENVLRKLKSQLDEAMLESKYDLVGKLSLEVANTALVAGESSGMLGEAQRYGTKEALVNRQEYERCSAKAQRNAEDLREDMWHSSGKCEYVWNIWKQTGKLDALNQLRIFLKERTQQAFDAGVQKGISEENLYYMKEYDLKITAACGIRALGKISEEQPAGAGNGQSADQ